MVYLLVFAFSVGLSEAPLVGINCEPTQIDNALKVALDIQNTYVANGMKCEKRDGIYEWLCVKQDSIFTITLKKDEADCRQTPSRTLHQIRTLMKKPTL